MSQTSSSLTALQTNEKQTVQAVRRFTLFCVIRRSPDHFRQSRLSGVISLCVGALLLTRHVGAFGNRPAPVSIASVSAHFFLPENSSVPCPTCIPSQSPLCRRTSSYGASFNRARGAPCVVSIASVSAHFFLHSLFSQQLRKNTCSVSIASVSAHFFLLDCVEVCTALHNCLNRLCVGALLLTLGDNFKSWFLPKEERLNRLCVGALLLTLQRQLQHRRY